MLSATVFSSPPNASDEQIIDSMQTVQLVPNTPTYGMWAGWIRAQIARDTANYHDFQNGQFVVKAISTEVDIITIKRSFHVLGTAAGATSRSHAPLEGKPTSLPINGEPGEHITVISQTPTTYLSWTYSWNSDADGGRGGWQLTGSAFHDCKYTPNRATGAHCERS